MRNKIVVGKSKIHGKGIFVNQNIKKGEEIFTIKGPKMFKINKNTRDALAHPDWIGFKMNTWIDPIPPYKYVNHSCNPNCGIKGKLKVIALKNIKEEEEITLDYSTTEMDELWKMKCSCGAKNCRKIIKSIESLSPKLYKRYFPNIPKDFIKIYEKKLLTTY